MLISFDNRWGFTPTLEARRFKHESVVQYLVQWMENKMAVEADNEREPDI